MPIGRPPDWPDVTALFWLGYRFDRVARRFRRMADDFRDVPWLGRYLFTGFRFFEIYFNDVRDKCYDADMFIREMRGWINSIIDGWKFKEILDWVSYHYAWIRHDPVHWVKTQVQRIGTEFSLFIDNPWGWFRFHFRGMTDWMSLFLDNPVGFITDRIRRRTYWFVGFLDNPIGHVVDWILLGLSFVRQLRDDAVGTVIGWIGNRAWWFSGFLSLPMLKVVGWLRDYSPEFYTFLQNPIYWVKVRFMILLGLSEFDLADLPFWVLRGILRNIRGYRMYLELTIEQVVSDIIMWYM